MRTETPSGHSGSGSAPFKLDPHTIRVADEAVAGAREQVPERHVVCGRVAHQARVGLLRRRDVLDREEQLRERLGVGRPDVQPDVLTMLADVRVPDHAPVLLGENDVLAELDVRRLPVLPEVCRGHIVGAVEPPGVLVQHGDGGIQIFDAGRADRAHGATSSSSVSGSSERSVSSRSGFGLGLLAEAVDPDVLEAELAGRRDVVEQARGHVHVGFAVGRRRVEESLPVTVGRLVGLHVLGDDGHVDRNAELLLGRGDQVAVGVREECELPATVPELGERAGNLREGRPLGKRLGERARFALGQLKPLFAQKLLEGEPEHLAVGAVLLGLDLRLELVVALEQSRRRLDPEKRSSSRPDPEVPVDQGAVAVEGGPALSRHVRAP